MDSLLDLVAEEQREVAATPAKVRRIGWVQLLPAVLICGDLMRSRVKLWLLPMPVYDFMTYWAAGRLFLSGQSPYSAGAMYAIERGLGWDYTQALVLLNPPWALPVVAALGVPQFWVVRHMWLGVSIALEVVSAVALWRYFGGARRTLWMALVVVATFGPAGSAEQMGQITPLMLAGLTAVMLLLRARRDVAAGACLLLIGMKPHLMYLVVLALVLWVVRERRWRFAMSVVVTYAAATVGAVLFNHNVLGYFHGSAQAAMDTECGVGGVLRLMFGMQHKWLQFVPTVAGTAWFAWYWRQHRREWVWEERLPMVLLLSLGTAPYVWAHDFVLALPAVVALAVKLSRTKTDWLIATGLYLVMHIAIFSLAEPGGKAWMAAASLLWAGFYWVGVRWLVDGVVAA